MFANKPVLLLINKVDVTRPDQLSAEDQAMLQELAQEEKVEAMCMSTLTGEGVTEVKTAACDRLLAMRVEAKLRSGKVNDVLNRVTVGEPKPRDNKERYVSRSDGVNVVYLERDPELESEQSYMRIFGLIEYVFLVCRRPAFIPAGVATRKKAAADKPKKKTLQERYMEEGPDFSWDHRGIFIFRFAIVLVCHIRATCLFKAYAPVGLRLTSTRDMLQTRSTSRTPSGSTTPSPKSWTARTLQTSLTPIFLR